jgi:hypothetical protein
VDFFSSFATIGRKRSKPAGQLRGRPGGWLVGKRNDQWGGGRGRERERERERGELASGDEARARMHTKALSHSDEKVSAWM